MGEPKIFCERDGCIGIIAYHNICTSCYEGDKIQLAALEKENAELKERVAELEVAKCPIMQDTIQRGKMAVKNLNLIEELQGTNRRIEAAVKECDSKLARLRSIMARGECGLSALGSTELHMYGNVRRILLDPPKPSGEKGEADADNS